MFILNPLTNTTVREIPDVDRTRETPRNLLTVVVHVKNDIYKLCKYFIS